MSANSPKWVPPMARPVALHSLGWMLAANLVGVWLALALLWPAAGDALAPLTYGRWVPLHLDWQLYGWCALPLVGVLLGWFFDSQHPGAGRQARLALGAWSAALVLGGIGWLGGTTSGRLFLDWHGWTRPLLPAAMLVMWALLAVHLWGRWRRLPVAGRVGRAIVLAVLVAVPAVLYWSAGREVHPAVNPDSGGATGAALLGSTLGIVTIYLVLPAMLGLKRGDAAAGAREGRPRRMRAGGATLAFGVLGASWLVFAAIARGDASHHAPSQIAALALLLMWIPLLPAHWAGYVWPVETRPWRRAATVWWALLVASGWLTFLPGHSEALKFTHGLVAHAHLAMAGFVTSVNGMLVITLTGRAGPRGVFWLWQGGCAVTVAAMLALGGLEAGAVAELFRSEPWTQGLLELRLAGGAAMTVASLKWLAGFARA
jgi:cytochrome c oxidase cbb3-type subunit 1